jgi:hypothetical protein
VRPVLFFMRSNSGIDGALMLHFAHRLSKPDVIALVDGHAGAHARVTQESHSAFHSLIMKRIV